MNTAERCVLFAKWLGLLGDAHLALWMADFEAAAALAFQVDV